MWCLGMGLLLPPRFLHVSVRSDALGVPSISGISCRDFLRAPVAAGFLVNCLAKCEVLRAFDEGEAVVNLVQGSPIERSVLVNFT